VTIILSSIQKTTLIQNCLDLPGTGSAHLFYSCRQKETDYVRHINNTENASSSGNLPVETSTTNSGLAAINEYLNEAAPQTSIGKLVKFSKHGEFVRGAEAEVIPEETVVTVACDLTLVGFIRWLDNKPAEHRLVLISSGRPRYTREQLGHHDKNLWPRDGKGEPRDVWQATMYTPMMDGDGEIFTFTTSSKSGINSLNQLLRRYATHAKRHPSEYPHVKLICGSFIPGKDKSIGEVLYPDFEPAGWVSRSEFDEALKVLGVELDQQVEHVEETASLPKPNNKDEFDDMLPF
jgi:hypothetical protein